MTIPKRREVWIVDGILLVSFLRIRLPIAGVMSITSNAATRPRPSARGRSTCEITPWIETLGRENVRIYRFEDYVADRLAHARDAWSWLGLEPLGRLNDPDKVYNRSEGKPAIRGLWQNISSSPAYRRLLRPLLPRSTRGYLKRAFVPKSTVEPDPPTLAALQKVVSAVRDDVDNLGRIMGRSEPLWDLENTVRRLAALQEVP